MNDEMKIHFLQHPEEIRPTIEELQQIEQEIKPKLLQPYMYRAEEALKKLYEKMEEIEFRGLITIDGSKFNGDSADLRVAPHEQDRNHKYPVDRIHITLYADL